MASYKEAQKQQREQRVLEQLAQIDLREIPIENSIGSMKVNAEYQGSILCERVLHR